MVTNSNLHYSIIKGIIDHGFAPSIEDLSITLEADKEEITKGLYDLQEYHGVVLHPNEPKIWVIHPFSLAPTNFYVKSNKGEWWGNCAWCSLGIASLIEGNAKIVTTLGAETDQIEINIIGGEIQEKDYVIHFPIPMKKAWNNVIYTCSNMLIFKNVQQVDQWTQKHNIEKGDVQDIENIWQFSKKWYGNHLSANWEKWNMDEAKKMFEEFELNSDIWNLEGSSERF